MILARLLLLNPIILLIFFAGSLLSCGNISLTSYYCHNDNHIDSTALFDDNKTFNDTIFILDVDTTASGLIVYYAPTASVAITTGMHHPGDYEYVSFCCGAAFTGSDGEPVGSYASTFDNVGYHKKVNLDEDVTGGVIFYGYPNPWKFFSSDYEEQLAKSPSTNAFAQHLIVYNGEVQPIFEKIVGRPPQYYRALCELNGKLCVIENQDIMRYENFVIRLANLHVKHALYLDMGTYNYEWYYTKLINGNQLDGLTVKGYDNPKASNWLLFYFVN